MISLLTSLGEVMAQEKPNIASYADVQTLAKATAGKDYVPQPVIPQFLKEMTYDEFRHIGFTDGKEIWNDTILPFRLGFYHKGYVAVDDVKLNIVSDAKSKSLPFSKNYFHYLGDAAKLSIPDDLGFAGFRVKTVFPGDIQLQEIFSFVGASYFRARAANTILGTSTRGLALDCGLPKVEEFPIFREYWIVKPKPGDATLKVFALMDSPSVSGAYEFLLTAGNVATTIDVHETLYFRKAPEKVGIAPMSSMWLWGDGLKGPEGDHRPEVHDSDGLQVLEQDGKWLWRALNQQSYPSIVQLPYQNSFKGFGLIQRDTRKESYLDDEALYHMRPSVWIEPKSDWGAGRLELLELDAPHEGIDNIAAWWVPEKKIEPGSSIELSYQISYFLGDRPEHDKAKAVSHRVTRDADGTIFLEVDFNGPGLDYRDASKPPVIQILSIRAAVTENKCEKSDKGLWTAKMTVKPTKEGPIELRIGLKDGEEQFSETWSYLCPLVPPKVELPPWKKKPAAEADVKAEKPAH